MLFELRTCCCQLYHKPRVESIAIILLVNAMKLILFFKSYLCMPFMFSGDLYACTKRAVWVMRVELRTCRGAHSDRSYHSWAEHLKLSIGMIIHTCNPSTQMAETGGLPQVPGQPGLQCKYQASQHYIVRFFLRKPREGPCMVAHTFNPRNGKVEAGPSL